MQRVVVFDTTILCVWLRVPGKDTCGPRDDPWDFKRVAATVDFEIENGCTLVLPMAAIFETGTHITNSNGNRFSLATALMSLVRKTLDQEEPWAAFSQQDDKLRNDWRDLTDHWPDLAARRISLADATIKNVAEYFAEMGADVEIFTGDQGLKAYEPAKPVARPRRRS